MSGPRKGMRPAGIATTRMEDGLTLEHLFEAELRFRPGMDPVVPSDGREGELIGSGDGTVRGRALRGTIRWTNFETQGDELCGMYPGGVIETDDGVTIRFDAKGFAKRNVATTWKVAGGMRFETDSPTYAWLQETLGVWEGEFDDATGHATWRVYGRGEPTRQLGP